MTIWRRPATAAGVVAVAVPMVWLSFADRAPQIGEHALAAAGHAAAALGVPTSGAHWSVAPDHLFHTAMWAAVAFVASLVFGRRYMLLAGGFVAVGMAIELAQPALSTTRMFEIADLAANVAGVAVGMSAAKICAVSAAGVQLGNKRRTMLP